MKNKPKKALDGYGLGLQTDDRKRSRHDHLAGKGIQKKEWVVVTGWTPHWMFGRYKLKVLDDPKQIYGKAESIHTVTWKGFSEKEPFVTELLRNIRLNDEQISSLMTAVEETRKTETYAAVSDERTSSIGRQLDSGTIKDTNSLYVRRIFITGSIGNIMLWSELLLAEIKRISVLSLQLDSSILSFDADLVFSCQPTCRQRCALHA